MKQKQRRLNLDAYVGKSVFLASWDTGGEHGFYTEEFVLEDFHVQYINDLEFGVDCIFAEKKEAEDFCSFLRRTVENISSGFKGDKDFHDREECYSVIFFGQDGFFSLTKCKFHPVAYNHCIGGMIFRDKKTAEQLCNKLNTSIGLGKEYEL